MQEARTHTYQGSYPELRFPAQRITEAFMQEAASPAAEREVAYLGSVLASNFGPLRQAVRIYVYVYVYVYVFSYVYTK